MATNGMAEAERGRGSNYENIHDTESVYYILSSSGCQGCVYSTCPLGLSPTHGEGLQGGEL